MGKRKRPKSVKQKLQDKAWKYFSLFTRLKGADWRGYATCITCGVRKHFKELQAGHRYHGKLDFDPINIHVQCSRCNHFLSGNLGVYERYIVKTYGQEAADNLEARAAQHPGYTEDELREIIIKYKPYADKAKSYV